MKRSNWNVFVIVMSSILAAICFIGSLGHDSALDSFLACDYLGDAIDGWKDPAKYDLKLKKKKS